MQYKVNTAIKAFYQAANATSGETVVMSVYDESQTVDYTKSVSAMTELGSSGRYWASFTPDANGIWVVHMEESDGTGPAIKAYDVGTRNMDSLGDRVEAVSSAVITDLEADIQAVSGAVGTDLSDDFSGLSSGIDAIASPAMVG